MIMIVFKPMRIKVLKRSASDGFCLAYLEKKGFTTLAGNEIPKKAKV